MKASLNKKEIKKVAKRELKSGKLHQTVYEELSEKYRYRKEIAGILKNIPSQKRLKQYGYLNIILLSVVIAVTVLFALNPSIGLIWFAILIYITATKQLQFYILHTLFGFIGILSTVWLVIYSGSLPPVYLWISIPVSLLFIVGGLLIPKLLTPKVEEIRKPYSGNDGRTRIQLIHEFNE
jgi:hypothetical protein